MKIELSQVSDHMKSLGLGALAHANYHANFFSHENVWWPILSVLQAAHAGEILIKARIAQQNPLLIFNVFPKMPSGATPLTMELLSEKGRACDFLDLPDRLWATTGVRLAAIDKFQKFARIRNSIQHFAALKSDAESDAIDFIYEVIDPFINKEWGLFAVDFCEDSEGNTYLVENLIRHGKSFLVSPGVVENLPYIDKPWPKRAIKYRKEMESRFANANREK